MVLFKKRIAKALIRLRGCAGWSAPLLFANSRRQIFSRRGPLGIHYMKENGIVLPRHFRKAYHSSVKMSTQLFVPIHMLSILSESVVQCTLFTFSKQTFNEIFKFLQQFIAPIQHLSRMCKTSLLFAPLAVRVLAGCSAFPLYTLTKPLIRFYFKYKTFNL